jgi:hypothetical protein
VFESVIAWILVVGATGMVAFMFYRAVTGKGSCRSCCSCSFDPDKLRKRAGLPPCDETSEESPQDA